MPGGIELQSDDRIIERAFELARSGDCASVAAIRAQLKKEHFAAIEDHLEGASIRGQLRSLIQKAGVA